MVFESIVVDLLNRILGDYFENLDTSQLKLGIWGGDVVLRDLVLKSSAIDDFGLPFKVVIGKLGKLTMKIPWSSIYTAPVELDLRNLYLLVVPSTSVQYNEQSEELAAQQSKQSEIARIDEIRKKEMLKKSGSATSPPPPDTFAEKLITQIIKNVQVRIGSIHIRYEDSVTSPTHPFSAGAILKELHVTTTDSDWKVAIITETVNIIHKLAKLEGLGVYWNSETEDTIISKRETKEEMVRLLEELVDGTGEKLTHVLGPISSEAKVKLTPSPEKLDFTQSKILIDVEMKDLAIGLTNRQFQDSMAFAESLEFMSRAQYYRKYRPRITQHRGHYKEWWKFAYRSIVEEDVRRKQLNWDWEHMKQHRQLVRVYADAYYQKLVAKKPRPEIDAKVAQCEKALDVFNITLVRKQVEMKVDRQEQIEKASGAAPASGGGGWFSGWFGGSSNANTTSSGSGGTGIGAIEDITKKFGEALTAEEKKKLYAAIDYTEGNFQPVDFPETYLEYQLNFHLHRLRSVIRDSYSVSKGSSSEVILNLEVNNVETIITTRPYKSGFKLYLTMGGVEALGIQRSESIPPHLISSKAAPTLAPATKLIEISFETNPLNSSASQRISVSSAPVEIVYHSKTIVELVRCFTLPPEMQLSKLQAATLATINEWKEQSAAGLQHLIETRGELDINVNFMAPYIVIPQGGAVALHGSSLVMDLGSISLKSKPRNRDKSRLSKESGKTKDEILQETLDKSYDSFLLTLTDFQILLALPGDDFRSHLGKAAVSTQSNSNSMQLITSKELIVQLDQSLVPDDPQLPKLKISGQLPLLDLNITETRLLELVKLLVTLPFPQTAAPTGGTGAENFDTMSNNPGLAESVAVARITYTEIQKKRDMENIVQFTDLVLMFSLSAIKLNIQRVTGPKKDKLIPLAAFELCNCHAKMTSKTFGTGIDVTIGGLALCASSHSSPGIPLGELYLLKTPMTETNLLNLKMFSITPDCPPQFSTRVKQEMIAEISTLDVILHQEALGTIITFVSEAMESFSSALETTVEVQVEHREAAGTGIYTVKKDEKKHISKLEASMKAVAKKHTDSKDVLLKVKAHLNRLTVQLSTESKNITKLVLGKLDLAYEQRPKKANMSLELTEFNLLNLDPNGFYKKIISQDNESEKVIYVHVTLHDDGTKGVNFIDMSKHDVRVKVETGSPKIVYLSSYLDEVLNFVDNFQLAKDAVVDASAAAVEAARENVESVYASSTRVLIDVELKTPQIIIPRNPSSSSALQANLGNLIIKNEFKRKEGNEASSIVIIDEIHATLTSMEMSRIELDKETGTIRAQILLLDPITLRLIIERNLSSDWYHQIPNLQVKGQMESASIRCSSEDYEILMACLTENVGGGSKPKEPVPAAPAPKPGALAPPGDKSKRKDSKASPGHAAVAAPPIVDLVPAGPAEVYSNVEVQITIIQTSLVLYDGSSGLTGKTGLIRRSDRAAFAKFAIDNITVDLTLLTNSNMNCHLGIRTISLEDIRPGEREINNLIRRNISSSTLINPDTDVIRITFRTDVDTKQGTTMILEITSMTFVLCLDYLLKIVGFFATASSGASSAKPDLSVQYEHFPTSGDPGKVTPREITPAKVKGQPRKESLVEEGKEELPFKMFFTMAETDVILVETMDRIDTNALLLNCEASVKIIIDSGKTNIMGSVNNIRLSTCVYDPELREKSLAEVISPMSISLVMNTSLLVGTVIDINISDIFIRLTAGTLELLLKISSSISAPQPTLGAEEGEIIERADYSEIWNIRMNADSKLWYLKQDANVEVGVDVLATASSGPGAPSSLSTTTRLYDAAEELVVRERLVLESGCIVLTFETGVGANTTPVLLIETDIDMQGFDWSEKLQLTGRLKLEIAYYNPIFGMWEFLVEPVETRHNGKVSHRPWELYFEYQTLDAGILGAASLATSPVSELDDYESSSGNTYASISLQSNDILELTITKTSLEVINMLTSDFQEAVKSLVSQKEVLVSPYTIVNDLGTDIKLTLRGSTFALVRRGISYEEALLKHGTSLNLSLADSFDMTKHHTSILKEQEGREERLLSIGIEEFNFSAEIPVNRADKRYYGLKKKTSWKGNYALVVDTTVKDTSKVVTIRGLVQIVNHLRLPVDVYYMNDSGNNLVLAGTVEKSKPLNLPLNALYTKSGEIYFAPKGYSVSTMPFIWTVLLRDTESITHSVCKAKAEEHKHHISDFHIKVVGEIKPTLYEATNRKALATNSISIHLKPPLIIDNLLPASLGYIVDKKEPTWAEQGHSIHVTEIDVGIGQQNLHEEFKLNLTIQKYNGKSWKALVSINKNVPELSPWEFFSEGHGSTVHSMFLGIHKETVYGIMTLHIYCPFWMVNRTGLTLGYAEDPKSQEPILHSHSKTDPLFFSFRGRSFLNSKKKAVVRVEGKSDWSSKFSLDVAGSGGSVICKSPLQDFEIGIEIVLNSWGLTKTVVFTPRYYLINQCDFIVEVTENERSRLKIEPKACVPFWPKSKEQKLLCRVDNTNDFTKKFSYEKSDQILLQLPNKFGGIHVDVHITEASHLITFSEFIHGQAPVLVVNTTKDNVIEVSEKGTPDSFKRTILPGMNQLMTWVNPMGEKTIIWSPQNPAGKSSNQFSDKLHGDGFGTYKWTAPDGRDKEYHWVSFLDGLQRVLLFTPDKNLVSFLQTSRDMEYPIADYTILLHGLGLSLVDNSHCVELLYLRIASSEVQWEAQKEGKRQRFKPLPIKKSCTIETAYQNYLNEKVLNSNVKSHRILDGGIELDFLNMTMTKPNERKIRRVFQTGAWFHYKTFPHTVLIHAKINRLQIDNQLPGCIFRTILAPVPPPKSVIEDDIPKPFAEVSIMERMTAHSSVIQYKYFKVLIQEFHIKMDISFVNALMSLFSEEGEKKLEKMLEYWNKDYEEAVLDSETYMSRRIVLQGQKNFYDYLHFSPLKIHLSFSMGGATQLSNSFLNLLIASLGVSVTEVQDVVFKLACMELQHLFMTRPQLLNEAYSHYSSQAIQQLYVLVLGLDVIGNPYGLLVGFTQGVGAFFYEPFHGAIQGPGEFMEGLTLGFRSLFGHTIGGMSGAMSKITGTFGKGVAALTLDDEFQKKRRENLSKRQTAADGFVESGKDLVMGFVDGVTGVVTKPVAGAKKEGIGGFFKGLGKGALGLVTRPAAGVIDFTSGSFDAVKKATSVSEEIQRMRPPRYIPNDTVLQPYVLHEAEGMQLFNDLDKGKYLSTDAYVAHALINPHGIYVLLLTTKRVLYLKKIDVFGGWATQWTYLWRDLEGPPEVIDRGLLFRLKPKDKRTTKPKLLACHNKNDVLVPLYSADVCTWILNKIETAMRTDGADLNVADAVIGAGIAAIANTTGLKLPAPAAAAPVTHPIGESKSQPGTTTTTTTGSSKPKQ